MQWRVADIPGAYDIQDSFSLGKRQFDIALTAAGEAAGLTPNDCPSARGVLTKKCSVFSAGVKMECSHTRIPASEFQFV